MKWDAAKAVLRKNFIVIKIYIKKKKDLKKLVNFTCHGTWKRRVNSPGLAEGKT